MKQIKECYFGKKLGLFVFFALMVSISFAQKQGGFSPLPQPPISGASIASNAASQEVFHFRIGKLKYGGGGDWYANPTSLPNLIEFINTHSNIKIAPQEDIVDPGSAQLFQYPYVYMTGHGNVKFSETEVKNLRKYLLSGGFLHIDDNYGMDKYIRDEIKKIFPDKPLTEIPFNHPIYHQQFDFAGGLPKIHEHDGKPAQGFGVFDKDRLLIFYSYETDLGDGWEDPSVHRDPPEVREKALKMGMNIVIYAINL